MSLLIIVDREGKEHLIHSSQIAPPPRKAIATGEWDDVWERFRESCLHATDADLWPVAKGPST